MKSIRTKKGMRNARLVCLLLTVISVVSLLTTTTAAASYYVTRVPEGDYYICASSNNNYCIDVINGSHSSGTYVHLYRKSNGNDAQIFSVVHYSGDWYKITHKASGNCLNVSGGNTGNGTRIWTWSNSDNSDASLWRFASAPNGTYIIQNKLGKCIDLDNNLVFNGSRVHTWDLHDGASVRWKLISASNGISDVINKRTTVSEGVYKITPTYSSSYAINIQYKSTATWTSNTVLDTYNAESNEEIQISSVGNLYYTLAPKHTTGRYLAVNGSKVTLSSNPSSADSQWYFVPWGSGYTIINRATNKALCCYSYYTGATVSAASVNTNLKAQNFQLTATVNWDSKVGTTVASIKNGSSYTSYYGSNNLSAQGGYRGQCTWYAYGRFLEVNGIALKSAPHAKYWLSRNTGDSRVSVLYGASSIKPKSIAVRTTGTYGHVMFIEHVTYNSNGTPAYVYFTECNADGNGTYNMNKDCILQKMTYSNFVNAKKPAGYIVAK